MNLTNVPDVYTCTHLSKLSPRASGNTALILKRIYTGYAWNSSPDQWKYKRTFVQCKRHCSVDIFLTSVSQVLGWIENSILTKLTKLVTEN